MKSLNFGKGFFGILFERHDEDCTCTYCIKSKYIHYGLNFPEHWKSSVAWYVIKPWQRTYIRWTNPWLKYIFGSKPYKDTYTIHMLKKLLNFFIKPKLESMKKPFTGVKEIVLEDGTKEYKAIYEDKELSYGLYHSIHLCLGIKGDSFKIFTDAHILLTKYIKQVEEEKLFLKEFIELYEKNQPNFVK